METPWTKPPLIKEQQVLSMNCSGALKQKKEWQTENTSINNGIQFEKPVHGTIGTEYGFKIKLPDMMLQKNDTAPDFELNCTPDQKIKLSELKGKKVILAFYPADWSPVCSDQMALYNETLKFFSKHNAQLLGISVDSKWCHLAFSQNRKLHFPLLADFEPKGRVAKMYGVYDEKGGECQRALFVIDEKGIISWSYLSPVGINPGADGILDALEKLDNV